MVLQTLLSSRKSLLARAISEVSLGADILENMTPDYT